MESHDDFARTKVESGSTRPWWYLLIIETGVLISIPLFIIGGELGKGLTFNDLLLSTILGGVILGVIGLLTARLGARTRCTTALIAKSTFGHNGAAIVGFILALGMTGWWAVQTEMFTKAVIDLVFRLSGFTLSREITIAVAGALMITTAALGIKAIGKLAYIAVPLLVLGISYALSTLFSTSDSTQILAYVPNKPIPFGAAVGTVVGGWIVGASMNADYARFARNTKHAIAYALAHYSFNYPLLLIVCGVMAIGFNTNDIVSHLVPPQLSWLLLVLMMLATWAANDCNLYSSSLSLTVLTGASRAKLAILAGIAGILLAEFRLAQNMVSFLVLLGVFIAPIGGVFIVNDSNMESEVDETTAFKWVPISAWLTGAFIGVLTTPKEALGLGLFKITGISTLDAVLVAAALMLLFQKIVKHR
ncbi:cytosine permease [bacterium]|nr:cytosine permease [bacterium]